MSKEDGDLFGDIAKFLNAQRRKPSEQPPKAGFSEIALNTNFLLFPPQSQKSERVYESRYSLKGSSLSLDLSDLPIPLLIKAEKIDGEDLYGLSAEIPLDDLRKRRLIHSLPKASEVFQVIDGKLLNFIDTTKFLVLSDKEVLFYGLLAGLDGEDTGVELSYTFYNPKNDLPINPKQVTLKQSQVPIIQGVIEVT